ncbi:LETM1-like protein-domain-containing protein [Scheffersomyces xylosifermentans]|uniref:LETM1-like protein-domain-containing protein n=1 Tax=Scheffersomyces xylosifermentans TaxID=1304137 RepID=UPI00315CE57D
MINTVLTKRSIGHLSTELFSPAASLRAVRTVATSRTRYPLKPSLHANSNAHTINGPLIKSMVRHQSSTSKNDKNTKIETIDKDSGSTELIQASSTTPTNVDVPPKKSLWEKVKHEAQHYWDGTKLLGYEIKVSTKLLFKLMSGYGLSRRESNQLQRTIVDVMRLVPFSMFVLVPFAELLLPIALKMFPNLLPSTYESKQDRRKKSAKLSKLRVSASEYIKKTMEESGLKLSKKISEEEKEAFVSFFDTISMGKHPSREHLIKVARLFKNDQVLDNLSRPQLVAMAKYMSLRPFGTDSILRYQIRHRLLTIIKDDKAIDYEGVESLTIPELQIACSQRGIKTTDVSPGRLRDDLATWLDLRLRQKIPSSLLILSSTYTYESYYDALLAVLSSIPDEVYNVAKLELSDDSKLKLATLKEQDELIQEENLREKDTVNQVKDNIKLDEYEDTATEGMKIEQDAEDAKEEQNAKSTESGDKEDAKEEIKEEEKETAKEEPNEDTGIRPNHKLHGMSERVISE